MGDPEAIVAWLSGSSLRPQRIIDPGGVRKAPELALDYVGTLDNAAHREAYGSIPSTSTITTREALAWPSRARLRWSRSWAAASASMAAASEPGLAL